MRDDEPVGLVGKREEGVMKVEKSRALMKVDQGIRYTDVTGRGGCIRRCES